MCTMTIEAFPLVSTFEFPSYLHFLDKIHACYHDEKIGIV